METDTLDLPRRCPFCGSRALVIDTATGEIACARCGAVVRERIVDLSGGDGSLMMDATRRHTGTPITLTRGDMDLSTVISRLDRDASGKGIGGEVRTSMRRLRVLDGRLKREERGLHEAMGVIEAVAGRLSIPGDVREEAARIYRRAVASGAVRWRRIKGVAVASVLLACRIAGIPRTLRDVSKASGMGTREVGHYYRLVYGAIGARTSPPSPEAYVERVASAVGANGVVSRRALEVLREARGAGAIVGRDPAAMAAAAVYIACLMEGVDGVGQMDVAAVVGVTDVTIRNDLRRIREALAIAIPETSPRSRGALGRFCSHHPHTSTRVPVFHPCG